MSKPFCPFPNNFTWGVATAAYQVEGATAEDGRTPSVWDTFIRRPGAIAMDQTGDRGVDHYHLYKDDVALIRRLGIKAYRFSASWSRVVPSGRGSINEKGLDFYERLVDELLSADIQPWLTLFHWDLPQWAEDQYRGWESKQCAGDFADYAALICKRLGDRLSGVFTINEFFCFLDKAYGGCGEVFAPGKVATRKVLNQARHHAVYGHGLGGTGGSRRMQGPGGDRREHSQCRAGSGNTAGCCRRARSAPRNHAECISLPSWKGNITPPISRRKRPMPRSSRKRR